MKILRMTKSYNNALMNVCNILQSHINECERLIIECMLDNPRQVRSLQMRKDIIEEMKMLITELFKPE